ncbi:hypothetical protein INR49_029026 [Caranx melampygus]|nr:hypothetical protein INR49_029026 [Caranx melampygus]
MGMLAEDMPAGLCINRWCLEELVKRDPHNFLILLQKILKKTKEVLERCQYELVVPLALLFSSTLLKTPHVAPDCGVLQEACLLFHRFLSWPEPCCSASKHLLHIIQQELKAPGISFQRLVRAEQGVSPHIHSSKTIDITLTLIQHSFQAAFGTKHNLQALNTTLQTKQPEELEQLLEEVTETMEIAASKADLKSARQGLINSMERLRERFGVPCPPEGCPNTGTVETFMLPAPKCHTFSWENDNFDILNDILFSESDLDSTEECFLKSEIEEDDINGINDTSVDEEDELEGNKMEQFQNHRISTASSSSRDSGYSLSSSWSVPSASSGVESDFSGLEDTSMGYRSDFTKDLQRAGALLKHARSRQVRPLQASNAAMDPFSPQKHVCVRRRPILSCDEGDVAEAPTLVRVVVFGGDKEAGRLARAYSDLQQKERKCPRLTKMCKLQFYFVPTKRRTTGSPGHTPTEGSTAGSTKTAASATTCKEGGVSEGSGSVERLPLLADLVLYYCRNADQPILVQLYQAELTLAGGEKRSEVFINSLELGHSAGARAVKAMGAASKRFGIDEEREAVPITLSVGYNKVAVSGRSQWAQVEIDCTSVNLYKACRKPEHLCDDSRVESLQMTMTEVLKRQCSKSKKCHNQHISVSQAKVDKVQVNSRGDGTTFAVCLDQDEKKFIQRVTRCEVFLCCKPGSSSDWRSYKPLPGQVRPLHPSYCSLLCLPITSFSA